MKQLKNTTLSDITLQKFGRTIPASSTYTVEVTDYPLLASDSSISELTTLVNSGDIVVRDGLVDLSAADGLQYLKVSETAYGIRFDNTSNGFVSKDVQRAIEELSSDFDSNQRFLAICGFDGSASSGRYLEFVSNVDSNQSGFLLPRNATLRELSLVTATSSSVTFQIIKYTTSETVLTTINTVSSRRALSTGLNIALTSNSEIRVKCSSGSGSRPIVSIWCTFD